MDINRISVTTSPMQARRFSREVHGAVNRGAAFVGLLGLGVGVLALTACGSPEISAANQVNHRLSDQGYELQTMESGTHDRLHVAVRVENGRDLDGAARMTASIVWRTAPVRIATLDVDVRGQARGNHARFSRAELEAAYGHRAARLDVPAEKVAENIVRGR